MSSLGQLFLAASRHGRLLLVLGLLAGILLPGLAAAMRPWLPELVGVLLFIAALRIGPRRAVGGLGDLPATAAVVFLYQLIFPVAAILFFGALGRLDHPLAMALVLMLSAPSISGSPNLALLMGHDPAPALRLLVLGTAVLPLTVLPILWLLPQLGAAAAVLAAALRLLAVIALAATAAFALRALFLPDPSPEFTSALDGLSAIVMAIVVVGLMSAVGPALAERPASFALWLLAAFAANFGMQVVLTLVMRGSPLCRDAVSCGIVAGNRNIALFLVALPAEVTAPLLLFIGCYQIPMYLTPLLLRRFYGAPA